MKKHYLAAALLAVALGGCKCPPGTADLSGLVQKIAAENSELRAAAGVEDIEGIKAGRNDAAVRLAKSIEESCE